MWSRIECKVRDGVEKQQRELVSNLSKQQEESDTEMAYWRDAYTRPLLKFNGSFH